MHPAVVMLHGRTGPYSSRVNKDCTFVRRGTPSPCDASTLSKRHLEWGEFWAERGYVALHVDSFGPRGKAHGFAPPRMTIRTASRSTSGRCVRSTPMARWIICGRVRTSSLTVLLAGADEEVSPVICQHLLERAKDAGSPVEFTVFAGASHGFDDPGRQDVPANHEATVAARARAEAFFAEQLRASYQPSRTR
jgi:dienelactone hydrolase